MKLDLKYLLIGVVLGLLFNHFVCEKVLAQVPLDPETELSGYFFGFNLLPDNTLPATVPKYTLKDTIKIAISFTPPTARLPLNQQPEPFSFTTSAPINIKFVPNAEIDYSEGRAYIEVNPSFLSAGEWQVQIKAQDLNDLQSKYSDAKGYVLETPPPNVPIIIEFMFVQ